MKFNNKMLRNIFLGMALFTAAAALHSCGLGNNNADDKQKNTGTVADATVEPLPITFVDSATGRARNNYYQKNKAAIVNSGGFYFSSVEGLKNQLQTFIKGKTGLRIYMAQTNTKKDSNNMALIFAPTVAGAKSNFTDAGDYTIVLPGAGSFTPIPKKADAEQYVKNYITNKKTSLDKTLTTADRSEGDTKSVLFSSDQINAICREMEYQKKTNPDSIKGMWIALTAHTDSDTAAPQRLNVIFAFAGKNDKPISIEKINPSDFNKRKGKNGYSGNAAAKPTAVRSVYGTDGTGGTNDLEVTGGMNLANPCPTDCGDGAALDPNP